MKKMKATTKKMVRMMKTTTGNRKRACSGLFQWVKDEAEDFVKLVEEALDSIPQEFPKRIRNVAVLVEESAVT